MTVKEIVDGLIRKTGVQPLPPEKTCDKLMIGSLDQEVTSIAVTFMATVDVVRKAADMGAQLIITHEPTWFTGEDTTDWLQGDPVYEEKKALIERTGISIWRFHDHMHMSAEDGIMRGFDKETGWGVIPYGAGYWRSASPFRLLLPDSRNHAGQSWRVL